MQNNWITLSTALQKSLNWDPINPDGSMYGLFRHHSKSDKDAILEGLQAGVGVAPGRIFYPGLPENSGYVRIHCGISEAKAHAIADTLMQFNTDKKS